MGFNLATGWVLSKSCVICPPPPGQSSEPEEPAAEQFVQRCSEGQLLRALAQCLGSLGPCQPSSRVCSVDPSNVLQALRLHVPEADLRHGDQHDVAEALEVGWEIYFWDVYLRVPASPATMRSCATYRTSCVGLLGWIGIGSWRRDDPTQGRSDGTVRLRVRM